MERGICRAAGVRMLAGGTSNHLILADVFGSLGIPGKEAEEVLDRVGITLNKNAIADDTPQAHGPLRHPLRHAGYHDARV